MRCLFDMAILRMKAEMLFVVQGTRSSEPGFVKFMMPKLIRACRRYKFQAKGYKNLSITGILTAVLAPLLLGIELGSLSKRTLIIAWLILAVWKLSNYSMVA